MDVLPDEQEILIQRTVGEFLAEECTPALVRAAEKNLSGYSKTLWEKFASLGWLGLCLPKEQGGQSLPLTYLGLMMEEFGRYIAPLPVYSTLVPALVIAKYGSPAQRELLRRVATGALILSFAVQERTGRWSPDAVTMLGKLKGDEIELTGSKYFVDNFRNAEKCLLAFRLIDEEKGRDDLAAVIVDTGSKGIHCEHLVPTAKDSESVVRFVNVHVPLANLVARGEQGHAVIADLMDYASVLLTSQMEGAARRAMELAVDYVKQRKAFGQPIGAFQAIQHLAADMVNAVDGTQLLAREAIWRLSEGLPASVEVSQAKSFANERCLMVCRSAQQMHGGIGFIAEFDLNLWYRRVTSWSVRAGTTYDHRQRIAAALLDMPGNVRLGMTLNLATIAG
jgi:alkylation response protein AidB-like acyl-CoA dehydrogenase